MFRLSVRKSMLPLLLYWLCASTGAAAPPAGMEVWVVGDSTRIDPTTNSAFEDNPLLFPDCLSGNCQESNLIWDANQRRISLRAARNETVAFQVVVERTGSGKLSNVKVNLGDLSGPGGGKIPTGNVSLYKEWYVHDFVRVGADRASLGSPGHWKHNSEDWERARIRMGELIEKSSR
jgi:hypothetical protein